MIHELFKEKVKLGKKGQITIPKCIRDEDNLKEDDVFIVQHMPGGDIILSKQILSATMSPTRIYGTPLS